MEHFKRIVGTDAEIISSVDHPYTSPPSHIFDAHNFLMEKYGNQIMVMNWDVSLPGERTYRYDLITDTGLIAKLPSLYHYSPDVFYCNQSLKKVTLSSLNQYIGLALKVTETRYNVPKDKIYSIQYYCDQILNFTQLSYSPTPWIYTKNLLVNFYRFVGRADMANFVNSKYTNYWRSEIMTQWIPWCIDNIEGGLSLDGLISNGVFLRTPFRVAAKTEKYLDLQNGPRLIKLIKNGEVIPSLDVLLWSLYIAGVKHYGNDFGFFSRLALYLNNNEVNNYQVTSPGTDAQKIVTLAKDYGVLMEINKNGIVIQSQKPYHDSKASRINSLFAGLVLGGNLTIDFLKNYRRGQKPLTITL